MYKQILLAISIATLGSTSAVFAMEKSYAAAVELINQEIPALLNGLRDEILKKGERAFNDEDRTTYPVETATCIDLINKLNAAKEPKEQEILRCRIDQQLVAFGSKVLTAGQKDLFERIKCTPEEKEKLKQVYIDQRLSMQKDVDDRAAKLGLPRLFNVGIWSKTKAFAWDGNRKFVTLSVAAIIGVVWYMRAKAVELDLKGRVKAFKNYMQTKLGLKKNVRLA